MPAGGPYLYCPSFKSQGEEGRVLLSVKESVEKYFVGCYLSHMLLYKFIPHTS